MPDAEFYSYLDLRAVIDLGANAILRAGVNAELPVLEWLPDGLNLSFIADPDAKRKNSYRFRKGRAQITDLPGIRVRVVDYETLDRGVNDELIALVTNMTDPDNAGARLR